MPSGNKHPEWIFRGIRIRRGWSVYFTPRTNAVVCQFNGLPTAPIRAGPENSENVFCFILRRYMPTTVA